MKTIKRLMLLLLLLILGLTFVSCTTNNNEQGNSENNIQMQAEDFSLVKPSELGERDYWELARTFDELSVQFINAIYSKDNDKVQELTHKNTTLEIDGQEQKKVEHVKQQAVVYENGQYNSIMQFGLENEPYRYFHIFFEDIDNEWKISDVQLDA